MLKIIQNWIDNHCSYKYWEVGKEDINNFLELKYSEWLKYKGMKLEIATNQVIFSNMKEWQKTYWYIHSSGALICDTLEPTHCGRKVVFRAK